MDLQILEGQKLRMENVLSYRKKINADDMNKSIVAMRDLIKEKGATETGPVTMATFSIEMVGKKQMVEVEILIPMDKKISTPNGYTFKEVFLLTNAVKASHIGSPAKFNDTMDKVNNHIKDKKLTTATAGYNVTVKEPTSPMEINTMQIDIYIGISENIL